MIDEFDASHDRLRLAVRRALVDYDESALFDCLSDQEPILRTAAARELHVRGTRSAYEHAMMLIGHSRFELREIGAFVLGQLGTPDCPFATETFGAIPRLLEDPYHEVQAAAAGAVGSLGSLGHPPPSRVLARLIHLASHENAGLRTSVAFALGMSRDPAALACLKEMRNDPDADVRDTAELGIELHEEQGDPSGSPARNTPSLTSANTG